MGFSHKLRNEHGLFSQRPLSSSLQPGATRAWAPLRAPNMAGIADWQKRAIERLEEFRSNAKALPALAYARYAAAQPSGMSSAVSSGPFALRKRKPHLMHSQHRDSCIAVLQVLIQRMDLQSLRVLYVNPKHKIRRNMYVPELSRLSGVCSRTVSRVLGSLERSRYLMRTATKQGATMLLSHSLFRDLNVDVFLGRLIRKLKGLEKAKSRTGKGAQGNQRVRVGQPALTSTPQFSHREKPSEESVKLREGLPTDESRAIAQAALAQLRPRRRPPPGS